jgi:uncharacterized LabA/DUF88 family protein
MQYLLNAKEETFNERVRTAVFVDYETWSYGCTNQYFTEPDVSHWFNNLRDKGQIDDVMFFADFTHENIKDHTLKLRNISNSIIDCSKGIKEKDYTDFIMLDHIYQKLFRQPEIKQFVLFTGDSHFQSVVAFLRNFNEKKVGIYALEGSLNPLLAEAADWYVRIVPSDGRYESIKQAIFKNLRWAKDKNIVVATFSKTVSVVTKNNPGFSEGEVTNVLSDLITKKVISQTETIVTNNGNTVKKLTIDERLLTD